LEFLIAGAYDFFYIGNKIFELAGFPAFFSASIVHLNIKSLNFQSSLKWRGGFRLRSSGTSANRQLVRASE
jgi:hypothetical protein